MLPSFGVRFYLCAHPLSQYGNTRVSCSQSRVPSQESGVPALHNFEVLLYLCLHPLSHGNTYGEERVLGGPPRDCICTNASRGLSATAEFLVSYPADRKTHKGKNITHIAAVMMMMITIADNVSYLSCRYRTQQAVSPL